MISLQNKLRQMGEGFAELTDYCYHYFRPIKETPCLIWYETAETDSFHADNHKQCQNISGIVDLFTKTEYDELADAVQNKLDAMGLAWSYTEGALYEPETGLIHHQWTWEVSTDGGDSDG